MPDERLLERIRNLEANPDARIEKNLSRKVKSIIRHLQSMLNTRQGSVLIAEDYGIPDITNAHGEGITEMTQRIENTLQDAVLRYEPRLLNVRVKLISQKDDILSMRFKLEAILKTDTVTQVVLETVVSSDGKIDISD